MEATRLAAIQAAALLTLLALAGGGPGLGQQGAKAQQGAKPRRAGGEVHRKFGRQRDPR